MSLIYGDLTVVTPH